MEENLPNIVRMAKACLPAMNSINKDLKFTTEAPEDFDKERLPTMDFMMCIIDGIIYHKYYEKLMKTQITVIGRPCLNIRKCQF